LRSAGAARPGFLPLLTETRIQATAVFQLEIPAVLALVARTVLPAFHVIKK